MIENQLPQETWRERWHRIIFGSDTPAGKLLDLILLVLIIASLIAIMLESVPSLLEHHHQFFRDAEWFFTIIFTIEYVVRLMVTPSKRKYIFSFYGIIDLISILPTYLALVLVGAQYFMVLRTFRLLRVFRVLKMVRFLGEARTLGQAIRASRIKITVFLIFVMCIVFVMGTIMYLIEGPDNGFSSIPASIYWCIVTLTTVGYGDIAPVTTWGQIIASMIMITGYGIIAVPTGIVTNEFARAQYKLTAPKPAKCTNCGTDNHAQDALFCKNCGNKL